MKDVKVTENELRTNREVDALLQEGVELSAEYVSPGEGNDLERLCDSLPNNLEINSVLRLPQIEDGIEDSNEFIRLVVSLINGEDNGVPAIPFPLGRPFGRVIPPGCIGIVKNVRGVVKAIHPGMWYIKPRTSFVKLFDFSDNVFCFESLTIVRVPYGSYGLAFDQGVPILLGEGLHVVNSRLFRYVESVVIDVPHISHQNLHLIRILDGMVGKIRVEKSPLVVKPGVYCIRSPAFRYGSVANANVEEYISNGTVHLVRVTKGSCALVTVEGKPLLLGKPGGYRFNSTHFVYKGAKKLTAKAIVHEAIKIITVDEGKVGVIFNGGVLDVLEPGRHAIIDSKTEFVGFLTTQSQSLKLQMKEIHSKSNKESHSRSKEKEIGLDLETDNFAKIRVWSEAYFRIDGIEGARKALQTLGRIDSIEDYIRKNAISTLATIIRDTSLIGMWQAKMTEQKKLADRVINNEEIEDENLAESTSNGVRKATFGLYSKENNAHFYRVHEEFLQEHGIVLKSIRIKDIDILDKEIQATVSRLAIAFGSLQIKMTTVQNERKVAIEEQELERSVALIKADMVKETVQKEAEAKQLEAEIAKSTTLLHAEARADALALEAKAEAAAIKIRGEAEAKRAEMLSDTKHAVELSKMELLTNAFIEAMKGVQTNIVPTDAANNPFTAMLGYHMNYMKDLNIEGTSK